MKNKDMLVKLYKKYNLTPKDIFKSPLGFTIINRSGIDKIQAVAQIEINYSLEKISNQQRRCQCLMPFLEQVPLVLILKIVSKYILMIIYTSLI